MDISVSILDNDSQFLNLLKTVLGDVFIVSATTDTNEFIRGVKQPAVLLIDWFLNYGAIGIDVMRRVRVNNPLCHVIFISSLASKETLLTVINEGWGCYFIEKDKSDFFPVLIDKIHAAKKLLREKIAASHKEAEKDLLLKEQISKTLKVIDGNGRGTQASSAGIN